MPEAKHGVLFNSTYKCWQWPLQMDPVAITIFRNNLLFPLPPSSLITALLNFMGGVHLSGIKLGFVKAYLSPLINSTP